MIAIMYSKASGPNGNKLPPKLASAATALARETRVVDFALPGSAPAHRIDHGVTTCQVSVPAFRVCVACKLLLIAAQTTSKPCRQPAEAWSGLITWQTPHETSYANLHCWVAAGRQDSAAANNANILKRAEVTLS